MASTTPTAPIVKDQINVITLKTAQDWHKAFKEQNKKGFAQRDIPNSIVIPFADIEQIVNDFRDSVKETVNGVRIYFVIKPGLKPNGKPNISAICVPTKGPYLNESDIDPNQRYTDMVIKAELRTDAPGNDSPGGNNDSGRTAKVATVAAVTEDFGDDYVSVYDLTRPCPPFCDPESPINDEE